MHFCPYNECVFPTKTVKKNPTNCFEKNCKLKFKIFWMILGHILLFSICSPPERSLFENCPKIKRNLIYTKNHNSSINSQMMIEQLNDFWANYLIWYIRGFLDNDLISFTFSFASALRPIGTVVMWLLWEYGVKPFSMPRWVDHSLNHSRCPWQKLQPRSDVKMIYS